MTQSTNYTNLNDYWLKSPFFDLFFLICSSFFSLILLIPYFYFGSSSLIVIYLLQGLFFGGPHFLLTYYYLFRNKILVKHKMYYMSVITAIALITVLLTYFFIINQKTFLGDCLYTIIFLLATWHNYRQHYGISKFYDHTLAHRWNDFSIKSDMKLFYWLYFFSLVGVLFFSARNIGSDVIQATNWNAKILYLEIPQYLKIIFFIFLGILTIGVVVKTFYLRHKNKKMFLLPQTLLLITSFFSFSILYLTLPSSDVILAWILVPLAHNLQYFGFVWLTEEKHTLFDSKLKILDLTYYIKHNYWFRVYLLLLLTTVTILVTFYSMGIMAYGGIILFVTIFHYLIDGFIWRNGSSDKKTLV